jgi:hypothetical protein
MGKNSKVRAGVKVRASVAFVFAMVSVCMFVIGSEPARAAVGPVCGTSSSHTLCVTLPSSTLTGEQLITVTNNPNNGVVVITWVPTGQKKALLQQAFVSNPTRPQDYSFSWPTQKYLDATGVLRAQFGSTSAGSVEVPLTLSNGNTTDFQHTPNNWQSFLPGVWTGSSDPVVAAVGDGASNEKGSNAVAASVASENPALFLYLGDVYEEGTFTEYRNHYGISSMDVPGGGTLWGALANITQPTFGNHEVHNRPAFIDYWHNRPMYTSFTFGGVLFLDLWSGQTNFGAGSDQYQFVQSQLASAPPCVVAFWHRPALGGTTTNSAILPMWSLLANGGADLSVHGDKHFMAEYEPLDGNLQPGAGAHMVQILAGSGGHTLNGTKVDPRTAWPTTALKSAGAVYIKLVGASNGGQATGLTWQFKDSHGAVLHSGGTTC